MHDRWLVPYQGGVPAVPPFVIGYHQRHGAWAAPLTPRGAALLLGAVAVGAAIGAYHALRE